MDFSKSVTFPTCFVLLHEIKVSNKSKNKVCCFGKVPAMTGRRKEENAPVQVQQFYYFAFDFMNFAVLLYAERTAAARQGLCRCRCGAAAQDPLPRGR